MKNIDTSKLSNDECWGIQINGMKHCRNCKWTGISACEGQNIIKTGRNSKGYLIGETGLIADNFKNKSLKNETRELENC